MDAPGRRGEEVARLVDEHDGGQDRGRGRDGLDAREEVRSGGAGGLSEVAVSAGEREREVHGKVVVVVVVVGVGGGVERGREAVLEGWGEVGGNHGGRGGGGGGPGGGRSRSG